MDPIPAESIEHEQYGANKEEETKDEVQ